MSKLSLIAFVALAAFSFQGSAQMEGMPAFAELQVSDSETRAVFVAWVNKMSERMGVLKGSPTFYGEALQGQGNGQCGLGFDGNFNTNRPSYVFLGESGEYKRNYISRTVDLDTNGSLQITMGERFIELRSIGFVNGSRDYRLLIETDKNGFPLRAVGKVYYQSGSPTYEITCEFPMG